MKNIKYLFAALAVISISSCEKAEDQYPSEVKEVSAPTITLIGDPVVILNVGDTYNDQGATYYDSLYLDNGSISTDTEISTDEEGFFIVTYTATNKFGFEGSGTRLIAVTSAPDALDVSGTYDHAQRGGFSEVTKIGRGVFQTSNISGGTGTIEPAYFMFTGDSSMIMPVQFLIVSRVPGEFIDPQYDFTPPGSYTYEIAAAGYGPGPRLFEKRP